MAAYFKSGNMTGALAAYEAGLEGFSYQLGREHPAIAVHHAALGDLYWSVKALPQAKVVVC